VTENNSIKSRKLHPFLAAGQLKFPIEFHMEGEDHDDGQPICRDKNTVRVSVSLTLGVGPGVRAGDVTQLTERVNESDSHNSLRGRTEERGADPRKKGDERSIRLCHLEPIKSSFEPPIKAGNRYHLQRNVPCSEVRGKGCNRKSNQPNG
jgi:hypothetical protein